MSCDLSCITRWVLFVYQLVTVPFYISVLVVLIRKRKSDLKSSFFNFCLSVGIADICAVVVRILGTKGMVFFYQNVPASRAIIESEAYTTASSMLRIWGFYYTQVSGVIILSFNRLTAVWDPFGYEIFWTERRKLMAYVFQWSFLLFFSLPQLHPCCRSKMVNNITFHTRMNNRKINGYFWTANSVFESCLCVTLVIMWSLMIYKVTKHANEVAPLVNQQAQQNVSLSKEKRYTIIGLVLCALYLYMVAVSLYQSFTGGLGVPLHLLVAVQFFTCSNPYLLLIFSSLFCSSYVPFITFGKIQVLGPNR